MRVVSFERDGAESYGVVIDTGIVEAGMDLLTAYPDVAALIEADAVSELEALTSKAADFGLDDVTLLPPVRGRNPILCVGRNYAEVSEQAGYSEAAYPSIFQRRHTAQVGHGNAIVQPLVSDQFDCEAELAVIVGQPGRRIAEADALDHIAGYTILNEASVVDFMNHTSRNVTPGKNFDRSGALGPWMVTADEVPDPASLMITQRINGEVVQSGSTADMIFSIPELLAYLSSFTELVPGDVIATGTPGGVHARRKAGKFLEPGDVVEMEIDGIGILRNSVAAEVTG